MVAQGDFPTTPSPFVMVQEQVGNLKQKCSKFCYWGKRRVLSSSTYTVCCVYSTLWSTEV